MPDTPSAATLPDLLDITRLAEHLGVQPRHIRRLVHEKRIPSQSSGATSSASTPPTSPAGWPQTAGPRTRSPRSLANADEWELRCRSTYVSCAPSVPLSWRILGAIGAARQR